MKITIQNGPMHALTRKNAEVVAALLPPALSRFVKTITLYQSISNEIEVSFHAKEKVLGLYFPITKNVTITKLDAIEELLIALSIISERGDLPKRMSKSLRERHQKIIFPLQVKCQEMIS